MLLTAALSPYLMLCAAVSAILLALARHWILAIVALGLTATTLAVQAPLYLGSHSDRTGGIEFRVLSANLREGKADPGLLVSSAREHADVLSFQELTPAEVDRLSAAGLDTTFPNRWLDARDGPYGVGVWSRFPHAHHQADRRIRHGVCHRAATGARRVERSTKPPNPASAKQGQAQGTLLLVLPQPLRQIFERDQHNRIIAAHQRRLAHPGPHRPTLTMPQLHN